MLEIGDIKIHWLGHAGFKIKTAKVVIYIDPYLIEEKEKADIILITHDHYDHCSPDDIAKIRKDSTVVFVAGSCADKVKADATLVPGQREEVKDVMTALLIENMQSRGIVIDTVLITDFDYSDSFNAAIEAKVTAEQNALAAKNKLAQIEYEAQQEVTAAKGKAEAQRYQIEALQVRGGKEYVQLQAINKWNGFLPIIVAGSDMPFIGSINFGNSSL